MSRTDTGYSSMRETIRQGLFRIVGIPAVVLCFYFIFVYNNPDFKAISNWWTHRTTNSTKRLLVFYPDNWPVGEYRNCMVDPDYMRMDCSGANSHYDFSSVGGTPVSGPTYNVFTIDVRFSGDKTNQHWTCQSGNLLVCKN